MDVVAEPASEEYGFTMSTRHITVILEPDADGTVHLPVPADLRHSKIEVSATVQAVDVSGQPFPATPEMIELRMQALEAVRGLNPFRDIDDPVQWQREIRKDRPLPGRD